MCRLKDAVSVCWMAVRYEHPSLYSSYPVSTINDVNTVVFIRDNFIFISLISYRTVNIIVMDVHVSYNEYILFNMQLAATAWLEIDENAIMLDDIYDGNNDNYDDRDIPNIYFSSNYLKLSIYLSYPS